MRRTTPPPTAPRHHPQAQPEEDFRNLSPQDIVEHQTVPGFMRRIPNRWHLDDINRFGDKVGRTAEALQLSYLTTVDRSLGVIRVFPVPLLQRVYDIMSSQFGWPRIIDLAPPALPETKREQREALKSHERVYKCLRDMLGAVPDIEIQHSLAVVLQWLDHECRRLRQELGIPEPEPEPTDTDPV